jgi:CPA2 family monovalent cation:H+ antiporter-2
MPAVAVVLAAALRAAVRLLPGGKAPDAVAGGGEADRLAESASVPVPVATQAARSCGASSSSSEHAEAER